MFGRFALAVVVLSVPAVAPAADNEKTDKQKEARQKEANKRFAKLPEYCKERRVTHVVELLAEWREFADANQQDEVVDMVTDLVAEAKAEAKGSKAQVGRPMVGYRGTRNTTDVKDFQSGATAYFLDGFDLSRGNGGRNRGLAIEEHLIVASHTFNARGMGTAENSVILTNAPTARFYRLSQCIVLSSGGVTADDEAQCSVVVCRGDAKYLYGRNYTPLVKAGGAITHADAGKKGVLVPDQDPDTMFAKDTKLLGVKFYLVAEDGLEATAVKEVVTVSKVDEKKAFGKAGIKKGDVIETINGEKVPSLHELDRLVCRATVASGTAKVVVTREKKTEEIEVTLFDWSSYSAEKKK